MSSSTPHSSNPPATGERGRFVILDGVDGCGKSTQAKMLVERLEREGRSALHLREPGSSKLGEELREIFLSRRHNLSAKVEVLLVAAARRAMLDECVEPALAAGRDVVCERFHSSTFAYQGVAGGQDLEQLDRLLIDWASDPMPDLIVLLDIEVSVASARRGEATDRMEDRGDEFQKLVAEGYRRYSKRAGVVMLNGDRDVDTVAEQIWSEVCAHANS
ncbi:MAG: dTMP kinase [Planctomycetota bacterium]|jgi:dTMP kinase